MHLGGIHHITAITADARRNLSFYAGLLGLRFVKKTVNFDDPSAYHLYYGDESGTPGSILTFFEYPGAQRGRAGDGMIHQLVWRVADEASLDFWEERLEGAGVNVERQSGIVSFSDPEGLDLELAVTGASQRPLFAAASGIPPVFALRGFDGVRAYAENPEASAAALGSVLGFGRSTVDDETGAVAWRIGDEDRSSRYVYDRPPAATGVQGAGTVHHIAWAVPDDDQPAWRERVVAGGLYATPIIDRVYFRSVYFREPSGVLFEIATRGPGFAVDEAPDQLGETLQLPPRYEDLRPRLERLLTPLTSPRERKAA